MRSGLREQYDVWVTGIGLVTPLGTGVPAFVDGLAAQRSGLRRLEGEVWAATGADVAGVAPEISALDLVPRTEARSVDRFVLMALAAADEALGDAKLTVGRDVAADRVAVVVSTGAGGLATYEEQAVGRASRGRAAVSPYLLPGMLPNMAAARIAMRHGVRGLSSSIATACAAGAMSVAEGLRLIREGTADVVVCGGTDTALAPSVATSFGNARALARAGTGDPAAASRPFDLDRSGFVLAEGAGILVLERAAHARARSAHAYGRVLGWGATSDAHHPTSPRPDGAGAADAMRRALADAGLAPRDIGYVNAHGTATKAGDLAEARAIRSVFGEDGPPVSSVKGAIGHLLGAAGAVEAAATVLALHHRSLPATANLDRPDPECALDHVRGAPRAAAPEAAVSNSFAFGGHNVSLVLGRAPEAV
ncbi:beta-ketoacyl-[acyl-carrier-protein] synthase family protein [Streptomyces sp. TBY4]|uniref:beta-ketoacyl-[acyl-carrier-protein] synthase family protein n=1 Tax=Streptomyces sp. TBY4 TaxID=2962030 RepID=UPI0020B8923B|nr:beta-ketoacyl-[acyl-carrier-protein] synthase family protein [Streptomyces sp. TBY4]MCP3760319.1 beta-ketoacyl-[acyl-carrier-protein] synthase family protein [Streptomyces sp. TBY4]